ncbi:MAG TPA: glycosyltransferase [Anaerolineae bacterium]|nr:glycosyltransferase [Anaerolineae bacterium]
MRILLHGAAFWAKSAYGIQLRHAIDILKSLGVDVGLSCTFGFQGRVIEIDGVPLFPALGDAMGNDVIAAHARYFGADFVLSLGDVFRFKPEVWRELPWIAWVTVDSEPLWPDIRAALGAARRVLAYSEYGQKVLHDSGIEAGYLPLCYDPEAFYPGDQAAARQRLKLPGDRFIVAMVQANRQLDNRKAWGIQLDAFREFQSMHADAFLYLHTCRNESRGGFPLDYLLDALEMREGEHFAFVDQYTEMVSGADDSMMRATYAACDVLLQATRAEGFGAPRLEANACGRPVIYTDHGASSEAALGFPVEWERDWFPAGSWWPIPRRDSIVAALEDARQSDSIAAEAYEQHTYWYRKDVVAEKYWRPLVEGLNSGSGESGGSEGVGKDRQEAEREQKEPIPG